MPGGLIVASVVEGHGEVAAVATLLHRIGTERLGLDFIHACPPPVRKPRSSLINEDSDALGDAVGLAALKVERAVTQFGGSVPGLVLVLVDADDDCPAEQGPKLRERAAKTHSNVPVRVVLAVLEYETWFAAAADSLTDFLQLRDDETAPRSPEETGQRKRWVEDHYAGDGTKYSETVDQKPMTAAMDLGVVHDRCPSFARLCRLLREAAGVEEERSASDTGRPRRG